VANDFDVRAKLTLDTTNAFSGVQRLSGQLSHLGQLLEGNNRFAHGLASQLIGVGSAYLGLNAIKGVFTGLTKEAVSYTSELEATKIGVQSILQAVEGGSWEDAGARAAVAFEAIKTAAIKAPASAQQMFDIFSGIVGPIEGAGESLEKVVELTTDTTLAASSLHVDFTQASRDVSMMVRGAAGVDVKLFSLLRSTNAIKESTEDWNKKLTAAERVAKLSEALAKFRKSGDQFQRSWIGVTSKMVDLKNEFLRAFSTPLMDMLARRIGGANDYLAKNQEQFSRRMEVYGERFAVGLEHVLDKGVAGLKWVSNHWTEITDKINKVANLLKAHGPQLLEAAKLYAGVSVGTSVAGKGLSAAGTTMGIVGGVGGLFAGGGSFAGGAFAGQAATAAAVGGGAAETAAAATAAGAALSAVAVGLVAVAAAGPEVVSNWDAISASLKGLTSGFGFQLVELGKSIWALIRPLVTFIGHLVLLAASAVIVGLTTSFRLLTNALQWTLDWITPLCDAINNHLVKTFQEAWGGIKRGSKDLGLAFGGQKEEFEAMLPLKNKEWESSENQMTSVLAGSLEKFAKPSERAKQKTSITNDFRGSNIKIDQKFEGDEDPDRIVYAMMSDLHKQAEMRLSTGYAGAFTR